MHMWHQAYTDEGFPEELHGVSGLFQGASELPAEAKLISGDFTSCWVSVRTIFSLSQLWRWSFSSPTVSVYWQVFNEPVIEDT